MRLQNSVATDSESSKTANDIDVCKLSAFLWLYAFPDHGFVTWAFLAREIVAL